MPKKLVVFSFIFWLIALAIWQIIFNTGSILTPVLWEIHTIFTSVILFYILINFLFSEPILNIIKISFRILFKVWFVIFIAFSIKKSFDIKGFLLTATFVFGYLEGLIDLNLWITNEDDHYIFSFFNVNNTKNNRIFACIILISIIHIFSSLIALVFFNIN